MLRFAALFRSAHETLKLSEKAQEATEKGASSSSATILDVTGPDLGGSSLSQICPSVGGPPIASADISEEAVASADIIEEAVWDDLCALDGEELTAVLEDANAVLFSDGTLFEWLNWRREYHGADALMVPDGSAAVGDWDHWRRFNSQPYSLNPKL